jgi:hypothetical protein
MEVCVARQPSLSSTVEAYAMQDKTKELWMPQSNKIPTS